MSAGRPSPLESALRDVGGFDDLARLHTPIHRLDPRAKVLTALGFVAVVVSFGKYDLSGLLPLVAYPVALGAAARLPARFLLRKLLLALPFALAVGVFNPLLDRAPLVQLGGVSVAGGWVSFASILLRFGLTVSAALILVATTGIGPVCLALHRMKVPRPFTTQIMLLYRYLFVLADEAARMMRAWSLRAVAQRRPPLRIFSALVAQLLLRALDRAQRLHTAMLCRGFDGEVRLLRPLRLRLPDAAFAAGWCAFFLVVRSWNVPRLLGRAAMGLLP